jgi:hypothetical protein
VTNNSAPSYIRAGLLRSCLEFSPQYHDRPAAKEARTAAAALELVRQRERRTEEARKQARKGKGGKQINDTLPSDREAEGAANVDDMQVRLVGGGVRSIGRFYDEHAAHVKALHRSQRVLMEALQSKREKDAKLAQKLGQLQPFIAVFPQ